MLAEWFMERYGWDAVWFIGSNGLKHGPFKFMGTDTCYVGVWTGPDSDLLCVRECSTREEAERCLAPSGWTITHAAVRSWVKFMRLRHDTEIHIGSCR